MSSFNKIIIIGHLGRDPELKFTPQGTAICKFSVATTERRKNNGENEEVATWFRVTCWGRLAEVSSEYLSKGKPVYLEGRVRLEEFTDRDGNKRSSLEVTATELQFIGAKTERGEGDQPAKAETREPAKRAPSSKPAAATAATRMSKHDDDEIPF